jgi:hypothetical protein
MAMGMRWFLTKRGFWAQALFGCAATGSAVAYLTIAKPQIQLKLFALGICCRSRD